MAHEINWKVSRKHSKIAKFEAGKKSRDDKIYNYLCSIFHQFFQSNCTRVFFYLTWILFNKFYSIFFLAALLILLLGLTQIFAARTVNNFLSKSDQERLQSVFQDGIKSNDLQSIYYSALNLKNSLKGPEKTEVCGRLSGSYGASKLNDFERNFYYVGTAHHLGCASNIPKPIIDSIKSAFSKDFQSAQDLYFNFALQKLIDEKVLDEAIKTKLGKNLQEILKKDDSLQSLGYGFYVASELGTPGSFAVERVEDALVQADEVNGQMLQFEGGLSITALVINGAYK